MIPSILLPRYFKWIGLIAAASGYARGIIYPRNPDDVAYPEGLFIQIAILVGLLLIAVAKEKTEDEMIRYIRFTSLQWSVLVIIGLRVIFKTTAFYTKDVSWLPHIEVNILLLIYLILFYYQLYIMEPLVKLFKKNAQ